TAMEDESFEYDGRGKLLRVGRLRDTSEFEYSVLGMLTRSEKRDIDLGGIPFVERFADDALGHRVWSSANSAGSDYPRMEYSYENGTGRLSS
ncbi:hypothetical protein, partial [Listeria monocytogenes]|uniref:hypothetical protein n=1 Tax=Listeria monocytogenes TaxID=1639 RepID=UPI002FDBB5F0